VKDDTHALTHAARLLSENNIGQMEKYLRHVYLTTLAWDMLDPRTWTELCKKCQHVWDKYYCIRKVAWLKSEDDAIWGEVQAFLEKHGFREAAHLVEKRAREKRMPPWIKRSSSMAMNGLVYLSIGLNAGGPEEGKPMVLLDGLRVGELESVYTDAARSANWNSEVVPKTHDILLSFHGISEASDAWNLLMESISRSFDLHTQEL